MQRLSSIKVLILILAMALMATGAETYTVRKNQSLWTIARRMYGRGSKWPRILYANINRIKNPNKIPVGMTLKIPIDGPDIPDGYEFWKAIEGKATAYDPGRCCCRPYADGKTSTGTNAWIMTGVAVDPKEIPYGTLVLLPWIGLRIADDTGSAVKGKHVDIRMRTHSHAKRWGTKTVPMILYRRIR